MGCKIIFSPQAVADLEEVVRHIAKDDPVTAVRVGNELIDRVEILRYWHGARTEPDLRSLE